MRTNNAEENKGGGKWQTVPQFVPAENVWPGINGTGSFPSWMPFLSPNQQCWRTAGTQSTDLNQRNHPQASFFLDPQPYFWGKRSCWLWHQQPTVLYYTQLSKPCTLHTTVTRFWFYAQLNTLYVILNMFFPVHLLASTNKLNLTQ